MAQLSRWSGTTGVVPYGNTADWLYRLVPTTPSDTAGFRNRLPAMPDDDLLTLADVAHRMRASERTVSNWINAGRLDSVRVGRRRLVPASSLASLLEESGR